MRCNVPQCTNMSGTSVVCPFHRKYMADGLRERMHEIWRAVVIRKGYDPETQMYECFHCRRRFSMQEITGDHWPFSRGARPDLKYDIENGKPSCAECNVSSALTRIHA